MHTYRLAANLINPLKAYGIIQLSFRQAWLNEYLSIGYIFMRKSLIKQDFI
jgi:hypothetical protein